MALPNTPSFLQQLLLLSHQYSPLSYPVTSYLAFPGPFIGKSLQRDATQLTFPWEHTLISQSAHPTLVPNVLDGVLEHTGHPLPWRLGRGCAVPQATAIQLMPLFSSSPIELDTPRPPPGFCFSPQHALLHCLLEKCLLDCYPACPSQHWLFDCYPACPSQRWLFN